MKFDYSMERVKGVEPSSPVWKTGALTVELHPQPHSKRMIVYHKSVGRARVGTRVTSTTASNQIIAESQKDPGTYH